MEKTIICGDCNKSFTYDENPKYPRKYCPPCSESRKNAYKNKEFPKEYPKITTPIVPQEDVSKEALKEALATNKPKDKAYPKDPIGLSVEVFVSMVKALEGQAIEGNQIMALAIQYVKQAENAFP